MRWRVHSPDSVHKIDNARRFEQNCWLAALFLGSYAYTPYFIRRLNRS